MTVVEKFVVPSKREKLSKRISELYQKASIKERIAFEETLKSGNKLIGNIYFSYPNEKYCECNFEYQEGGMYTIPIYG